MKYHHLFKSNEFIKDTAWSCFRERSQYVFFNYFSYCWFPQWRVKVGIREPILQVDETDTQDFLLLQSQKPAPGCGTWNFSTPPHRPWGSCSVAQSSLTLCRSMDFSTAGFRVFHYSPELAQTHVHLASDAISNHLILCRPFLLLPSIFPSIRVFSNESALCIRWPKYWSFSPVLPMNIQGWFPSSATS